MSGRPTFDEYFMQMARLATTRSTCHRRNVGAVIVKDNHVLATGYNGNPSGLEHCEKIGCIREILKVPSGMHHELCTGLHAEQNAIIQAARFGTSIDGGVLYTTTFPCVTCAKMIMNAGIKEVVYEDGYPDELGRWMLMNSRVKVRKLGTTEHDKLGSGEPLESVVATMSIVPNPKA